MAALITVWGVVALACALVVGRYFAVSEKSDRWRHGHREVRDLRRLNPVPPAGSPRAVHGQERSAA